MVKKMTFSFLEKTNRLRDVGYNDFNILDEADKRRYSWAIVVSSSTVIVSTPERERIRNLIFVDGQNAMQQVERENGRFNDVDESANRTDK